MLYYSTSVFESVLPSVDAAKATTVGVGGVMVAMTLVSAPFVDRLGRRALMLLGLAGMLLSSLAITGTLALKARQLDCIAPSWRCYIKEI